jgi:hypothetical protein
VTPPPTRLLGRAVDPRAVAWVQTRVHGGYVMRYATVAVALAAAALGYARPAAAAVTTQFNIVGPTTITAVCPTSVTFTGTITGPAGTKVTYHFSHYAAGAWAYSGDIPAAIPMYPSSSNNTLPIKKETLTIDSAHAGFQSNQVDTTVPNASEGKVFFTVNCRSALTGPGIGHVGVIPTPTPHPRFGGTVLVSLAAVAPVTNLHPLDPANGQNNNLAECRAHGDVTGLGCAAAFSNHWYVLVWDWSNANCPVGKMCAGDVDGYRVYYPGTQAHPLQISQGAGYTIQAFDPNAMPGSCVKISAYKGNLESAQGALECLSPGNATTPVQFKQHLDVTLQPAHMRTSDKQKTAGTGVLNSVFNSHLVNGTQTVLNGVLITGYSFSDNTSLLGDSKANDVRRGGVAFDLSAVRGHAVDFAILHLHVLQTMMGDMYQMNYDWSCATELVVATRQWWYDVNWLDGWGGIPLTQKGPNIDVDVAGFLGRNKINADPYGFVLIGGSENIDSFAQASCQTQYDNVTLEVGYQS